MEPRAGRPPWVLALYMSALCVQGVIGFLSPAVGPPAAGAQATASRSAVWSGLGGHGLGGLERHQGLTVAGGLRCGRARGPTAPLALRMDTGRDDDMNPEEMMIERLVEKLETTLDTAIKQEHFKDASTLRDELSRMHFDDSSAVLQRNSEFYTAFSKKNIELMKGLWLDNDHVQCIHPGSKPLVGYNSIIEMWASMFSAKDAAFTSTNIRPGGVRVHVRGTSAYVMCSEEVTAPGTSRRMVATNIFRKYGGKWYLVHHHASQSVRQGGLPAPFNPDIGASPPRIIRIDGANVRDSSPGGSGAIDDVVKAIMGALEGGQLGDGADRFADGGVGGMMLIDDEEDSDDDEDSEEEGDDGTITSTVIFPPPGGRDLTEDCTERTIEALRTLVKLGKLSKDHKRRLLSDIIHHHQRGEDASSIEVAYELLVIPFVRPPAVGYASPKIHQKEEECLDEFAAQAKIIAKGLGF